MLRRCAQDDSGAQGDSEIEIATAFFLAMTRMKIWFRLGIGIGNVAVWVWLIEY